MEQRIVCAANKYVFEVHGEIETLVVCGARHYDPLMRAQINVIDEFYWSCKIGEVQGFVDQRGNFLTREEAFVVAKTTGQIIRDCGNPDSTELFSEHLY